MTIFKPMLANKISDLDAFDFGNHEWLATPKLDGVRALLIDGHLMSRSLKAIPNHYIRDSLSGLFAGTDVVLDGELMIPDVTFQEIVSGVMSHDGEPPFLYHVFDCVHPSAGITTRTPYKQRVDHMAKLVLELLSRDIRAVAAVCPLPVKNKEEFLKLYNEYLERGLEGIMLRKGDSPYKHGRSTFREGWLLKCKPEEDSEAIVVGYEQRMSNQNEATINALGHTERSSRKVNLVPVEQVGTLLVKDVHSGLYFGVGTGLSDAQRTEIWQNQEQYLGKVITYRFSPVGVDPKTNTPRFPSFKGFRHQDDMSPEG